MMRGLWPRGEDQLRTGGGWAFTLRCHQTWGAGKWMKMDHLVQWFSHEKTSIRRFSSQPCLMTPEGSEQKSCTVSSGQSPFRTVFHLLSYLLQRYLRHWNAKHIWHTWHTWPHFPFLESISCMLFGKHLIMFAPKKTFLIIFPNTYLILPNPACLESFSIIFHIRPAIKLHGSYVEAIIFLVLWTSFFSFYIGNSNPNWLSYFSEGLVNHQKQRDMMWGIYPLVMTNSLRTWKLPFIVDIYPINMVDLSIVMLWVETTNQHHSRWPPGALLAFRHGWSPRVAQEAALGGNKRATLDRRPQGWPCYCWKTWLYIYIHIHIYDICIYVIYRFDILHIYIDQTYILI